MLQYKSTLKILSICLVLQILQFYHPSFINYQTFVPAYILHLKTLPLFLVGLIVHMFSHGGWAHLRSNMFVGIPCMMLMERTIGNKRMLDSYVLCGVVAALTQMLMPFSGDTLIGASGAIFGLLGMCCVLLGRTATQNGLLYALLALRIVPQLANLNMGPFGGGIAYAAHIGGLMAGVLIGLTYVKGSLQRLQPQPLKQPIPTKEPVGRLLD